MSRAAEPGDSCAAESGSGDSAGVPWEGRAFRDNPHTGDDGTAPPSLLAAIADFRSGRCGAEHVVDALRTVRLLIPLVAERGDEGLSPTGQTVDKTQELSIVTVAAPDGRTVMPAFTSVTAMTVWDAAARPIPTPGVRVAQAAVGEGTDLIVVDPGSETEFVVRRPAVWALAHGEPWRPPHTSEAVRAAFLESISSELAAVDVHLAAGDPDARLAGPETVVRLRLLAGLERHELDAVLARLAQRWAADDRIATLVDSLTVALERAP
ncbi:SseB family protein [Microbacterium sp. LRZ72]|uniref:SseB family protein n=1 Tax=Microbacterium sp. LRZ72 TaxID=2942481 RepID=UPI0029ACE30E|nr:SseB family protein [Microbacterium sp. LRZ72]MDX2375710.1 SseB family protein [Microbacterium sp. LRZ72]